MERTVRNVFSVRDPHPSRKQKIESLKPPKTGSTAPNAGVYRRFASYSGFTNNPEATN